MGIYMQNTQTNDIIIGTVVAYKSGLSLLSRKSQVVVNADGYRLSVEVLPWQVKFLEDEFPRGSEIAVAFESGKWHIADRPHAVDVSCYDSNVMALETLNLIGKSAAE